jgi:glycosyltransferase involved in cell wall biosynthesis
MRFLFIHQNFPGQFKHVAAALAARGHEVVALGVNQPAEPLPGVRHVLYRCAPVGSIDSLHPLAEALDDWNAKVARGAAAARVMQRLRKDGFAPDLILAHPGWGEPLFAKDVFPRARLLVYAEYFYGGPGGDTGFDPEFTQSSDDCAHRLRIKNTHLLHALSACDAAISPTEFQKDRHPEWAHDRIRVIHDGIDTARFRPDPAAAVHFESSGKALRPQDEVVTFCVRQLEPYRGYHTFMRALPLLQRLRPQAHVIIVGGDGAGYGAGPPKGMSWRQVFLREVADRIDLQRIHFVGRLPHPVLTQLMQVSSAHVYLTYPFVLSWSLLEAMSVGCLVIGSDTAPVREVLEHGRNGLLADFFDAEALAHCIAEALAGRTELAPLRAAARETIVSRFDLQRLCLPAQLAWVEQVTGVAA